MRTSMFVLLISLSSSVTSMLTGCDEPARLQEVANVPGFYIWELHADGDLLYAAEAARGLLIFDVSDPLAPELIGEVMPNPRRGSDSVVVAGQYAYVGDPDGLSAIDVSDPSQPVTVGQTSGDSFALAAEGDHVYTSSSYVRVFDVSARSTPEFVGELKLEFIAASIVASGDLVYAGSNEGGMHIIDVSNPAQPILLSSYDAGRISCVAADNELVYGAGGEGLFILDAADPLRPRLLGHHATSCPAGAESLAVHGNHAYLTANDCLEVYDVSDSESPRLIAILDALIPIMYWDVAASNGHIFLAHAGGLRVFPQEN